MKILICAVLLAFANVAFSQTLQRAYHPYRKSGDRYYSLQPLYDWIRTRNGPRPMTEWIGVATDEDVSDDEYKVLQRLPGKGLLITPRHWSLAIHGMESRDPIFLINYPWEDQVVDGEKIEFLALRIGSHQYKSIQGALTTVAKYDYGIPYNPFLKKDTNSVAGKP